MHIGRMFGIAAALAASAVATEAPAITVVPISFDGSFGMFSEVLSGATDYNFTFTVPDGGVASVSLTSLKITAAPGLALTKVSFDDMIDIPIVSSSSFISTWSVDSLIADTGSHFLHISTSSGLGIITGSVGFSPDAVPEPAMWMLMVIGFGAIGNTLRRRPITAQWHA